MLEDLIVDVLKRTGRTWTVKGGQRVEPGLEHVEQVLDEGVRSLYNGTVGDRLNLGGLIIEKRETGYDVYVHVGHYR